MGQVNCSWKPPELYWSLLICVMKGWASVKDLQLRRSLNQRVTTIEISRRTSVWGPEGSGLCLALENVDWSLWVLGLFCPLHLFLYVFCLPVAVFTMHMMVYNATCLNLLSSQAFGDYSQIASSWSVSWCCLKVCFGLCGFCRDEDGGLRATGRRTAYMIIWGYLWGKLGQKMGWGNVPWSSKICCY